MGDQGNQGGEGSGNAGSSDKGQGGSGGDTPKYITEDQLNKAISGRFSRFEKTIGEKITAGNVSKEDIAGIVGDAFKARDDAAAAKTNTDQGKNDENEVLMTRLSKLEGDLKNERGTRKKVEQDALDKTVRQRIASALQSAGVSEGKSRLLAKSLHERKIARYEGDAIVLEFDDEVHGDVKDGVGKWLATTEGKEWAPAAPAGGSGSRPARAGASGNSDGSSQYPTEADIAAALTKELR